MILSFYFLIIILLRSFLYLLRKVGMSSLLEVDRMVYLVGYRYLGHLLLGHKHNRKHHKHIFSYFLIFKVKQYYINVYRNFFLNIEDVLQR